MIIWVQFYIFLKEQLLILSKLLNGKPKFSWEILIIYHIWKLGHFTIDLFPVIQDYLDAIQCYLSLTQQHQGTIIHVRTYNLAEVALEWLCATLVQPWEVEKLLGDNNLYAWELCNKNAKSVVISNTSSPVPRNKKLAATFLQHIPATRSES